MFIFFQKNSKWIRNKTDYELTMNDRLNKKVFRRCQSDTFSFIFDFGILRSVHVLVHFHRWTRLWSAQAVKRRVPENNLLFQFMMIVHWACMILLRSYISPHGTHSRMLKECGPDSRISPAMKLIAARALVLIIFKCLFGLNKRENVSRI